MHADGSIELRQESSANTSGTLLPRVNVKAQVLNESAVDREGDLAVPDLLARCTVVYEGKLITGRDGGTPEILGGTAIATKDFEVKILGCHT